MQAMGGNAIEGSEVGKSAAAYRLDEPLEFDFEREVALEVVLYLANRIPQLEMLRLCKLLYLAEKLHLSRWGDPMYGERYVAMKRGPVPGRVYEMLKSESEVEGQDFRIQDGRAVLPRRREKAEFLSQSIVECLDEIIAQFGEAPLRQVLDESHDLAYEEAWQARGGKGSVPLRYESIVGQLDNGKKVLAYMRNEGY